MPTLSPSPPFNTIPPTSSKVVCRTVPLQGRNTPPSIRGSHLKVTLVLVIPPVLHIRVCIHVRNAVPHPSSAFNLNSGNEENTPRSLSPAKRAGNTPRNRSPTKLLGDNNPASPRSATPTSLTPSRSASRAASPLRFLQQWALHRTHSRDEPFIPIDPFKWNFRICSPGSTDDQSLPLACCIPLTQVSDDRGLFSDTLPRQLYLCLLLWLPAVYFSRVARIFEDAEVSRNDMQRIIESSRPSKLPTSSRRAANNVAPPILPFPEDWTPPAVSPALARFKNSWEDFIDSLLREWKALNLVSALICSFVIPRLTSPSNVLTRFVEVRS